MPELWKRACKSEHIWQRHSSNLLPSFLLVTSMHPGSCVSIRRLAICYALCVHVELFAAAQNTWICLYIKEFTNPPVIFWQWKGIYNKNEVNIMIMLFTTCLRFYNWVYIISMWLTVRLLLNVWNFNTCKSFLLDASCFLRLNIECSLCVFSKFY